MTLPPPRRVEPLAPPAGLFTTVLERARARRRRQLVLLLTSVLALSLMSSGAFAITESLNGTTYPSAPAGSSESAAKTTDAGGHASPSPSATHGPRHAAGAGKGDAAATSYLRGRAVDAAGTGIAGLLVQPGIRGRVGYSSDGFVAAITDADGRYRIPCPHAPVLLATWQLDHAVAAASTGGSWAATFVGGPRHNPAGPSCGPGLHTTTIGPGATLTGIVQMAQPCVPDPFSGPWLWLGGDSRVTVRLTGLHVGDRFTFAGLPAGTHTLGAGGTRVSVNLSAGATTTRDAEFPCIGKPPPSPPPTSEPPTSTPPADPPPNPLRESTT